MKEKKSYLRLVEDFASANEKAIYTLVERLVQFHASTAASAILKMIRLQWRDKPVIAEGGPRANPAIPTGPYRRNRDAALLFYVPRDLRGRLIDDLSGHHGFSHLAIDCGETDLSTGKPVMVESTIGDVVHRRFFDQYGSRPFARLPLKKIDIDPKPFCDCVTSRVGEKYDYLEALTWGEVDDPARQVCSDLAADCLPEDLRHEFAEQQKEGKISPLAVSVHHRLNGSVDVFISPNGFCDYYGLPHGRSIDHPNQTVRPFFARKQVSTVSRLASWAAGGLVMMAVAAWFIHRLEKKKGLVSAG